MGSLSGGPYIRVGHLSGIKKQFQNELQQNYVFHILVLIKLKGGSKHFPLFSKT